MKPYRVPKWLVIVSTVIFFILIASGYGFFQAQQNSMRVIAERDLFAVANSKLDQITLWRENQLAEGVELMSSVHLKRGLENWIRRRDAEGEEIIRTRMQSLVEHYHYQEILLLTPDGRQLMSFTGKRVTLHPEMLEALSEAQDKLRPILSDIHFGKPFDFPHITLAVPMALDEDDQTTLLGYFLLVIDANDFLYPLIQSWPLPSETAETLLIRQDGDDALFLNELRHLPDTAFNLRIPLTEVNVPAVKAILEENGIVEGLDYRGVPVIAAIQPVPDTTWFMVSKIDQAEALAVWRTNAALIVLMILGGMGTAGGFAGFIWQRDAKHHFLELAQSELARRESEERHRVTLMSVGDAVIVTDPDGTVQLMNPVAEYLTGWPLGEASGKPLEEVFHIINEESRQRVENHAKKVMREGNVVGLANHTLLVSRDGLEYPIADSGAPIRFEQGEISGVVLVFRDQSEEHEAQHRLEESEKKFRTYFESSPTAISLTSPEGKYIGVNRAYCKMTGYTEEEVIGKPATNFTYADDRQEFEGRMSDSLTGNQRTHQIEKRLVVKNGEILWVAGNTNLITDGDGKPLFFLSHMINITHQKEAEEKLKISEERFRVAQEISPDGFTILHPVRNEEGEIVDFTWVYENQTIAKINGTDPEEVIGQQLLSIFPDHSGTPVFEAYLDVANTNKNRILEEVYVGEILSKPTWLRLVLVSMDEDIAILAQDITERKLAEKQLQERNDFIQTILDNLPMGIAVNSVASGVDFSYMNDKFLEFYRTTRAALAQTDSFWEAVYEDEELREEIRQRVIRDTSSGDVNRMQWDDIPIQRKGEKTTYISARNIPIQRNELMVSVVWDSTHRREAEEAIRELNVNLERKVEEHTHELKEAQEKLLRQERLAVLGQLAGSVSHELRNPLGVISNSIYILSTLLKDADDKAKEYLQMINEETKRSEKIISDMLDFSKVRIPDARAFGIDEAIQSVLGRMTIPKNIGIVKNLESTLPSAFADPLHIAQILDNILINAVQAMPTGGELTISVSLHWQERNEFLRLEVKDSGEGMSDEVLSKIFEPLFTTKARGIGLGLPLSKSLIEANGGWIEAKSQAGQGSTFIVYIPTYQEEEK